MRCAEKPDEILEKEVGYCDEVDGLQGRLDSLVVNLGDTPGARGGIDERLKEAGGVVAVVIHEIDGIGVLQLGERAQDETDG